MMSNISHWLVHSASIWPFRAAIIQPSGRDICGRPRFIQVSFQQLNQLCDCYAFGLKKKGLKQGDRVLLLIRPSIELVAVTFAIEKIGAIPVLIDPGMGRKAFLQCVDETSPIGLIGEPEAHFLRWIFPFNFRSVKIKISTGRRSLYDFSSLNNIVSEEKEPYPIENLTSEAVAAITFTSGSTGIPKGVVYLHGMFQEMINLLKEDLGQQQGEIDLPGLYIFALLNPMMGITTVFPEMDVTKPSKIDPNGLVETINTFGITTSFGSPTIWKILTKYCLDKNIYLPSIRRIYMAGAAVPPSLIRSFSQIIPNGEIFTPFGATEALPITNISGKEILADTAQKTEKGMGVCVGRNTHGNQVKIIEISDQPIKEWKTSLEVPGGMIGEIVVKGRVVTREYLNRPLQTDLAKIKDHDGVWHRMGDLGYLDDLGRLWIVGRKAHRVETSNGIFFPDACEEIFNQHPQVLRSALVGVSKDGQQIPLIVIELKVPIRDRAFQQIICDELKELGSMCEITKPIKEFLFFPSRFPVDVRHNVKIQREKLAVWAQKNFNKKSFSIN